MIPLLIRLPEEDYHLYKELARERGISLAEYFRVKTKPDLVKRKRKSTMYSIWDLGTKIVAKGGPRDGSVNHDKYYYEFEAAKRRLPKAPRKKK